MLNLETLNLLLAITEGELIEDMIVAMLAAPHLSAFFRKFPALRRALDRDLPRWKLQLKQRIHEAMVPPALAQEFYRYQQCQLESNAQFYQNLNDTLELLRQLVSPSMNRRASWWTPPICPIIRWMTASRPYFCSVGASA